MDGVLEAADAPSDSGLEGIASWLLGAVGLVVPFAGVGPWLLTDARPLVSPALLMAVGAVLLVIPGIVLALAELA